MARDDIRALPDKHPWWHLNISFHVHTALNSFQEWSACVVSVCLPWLLMRLVSMMLSSCVPCSLDEQPGTSIDEISSPVFWIGLNSRVSPNVKSFLLSFTRSSSPSSSLTPSPLDLKTGGLPLRLVCIMFWGWWLCGLLCGLWAEIWSPSPLRWVVSIMFFGKWLGGLQWGLWDEMWSPFSVCGIGLGGEPSRVFKWNKKKKNKN